ncbi:MAG: alpha/beta hydrolase [Desulfobacterales bacterium]|jgi:pimeloyl-ACP methyl ester carboxylesterase
MSFLQLDPQNGLYYEHHLPVNDQSCTFVYFNALTSDISTWDSVINPILHKAGYGTLTYNMRGQTDSVFSPDVEFSEKLIVEDALGLLAEVKPVSPILVGLSIGGLFACRTWLKGADAIGLALINTLRREGPRLQWISDALVRAAETGGLNLFRDLYLPLLMNDDWLRENRSSFLSSNPDYTPLEPDSGHFKLLSEAGRKSDWNLPYEQLTIPTLVITGLQDHVFFERDVVDALFDRLPKGKRIDMPDAGHLIPSEQPEALAEILISFAKEIV